MTPAVAPDPPAAPATQTRPVAELDRRFYAFAVDRLIAWSVDAALAVAAWRLFFDEGRVWAGVGALIAGAALVGLLFAVALGTTGSSPGKALLGLRAVDADTGRPVGIGRAVLRTLVLGIAGLPTFGLGVATLAWTAVMDPQRQRRGWHDRVSGSSVVDVRPEPEAVVEVEEAPRQIVNLTALRLVPAPSPAPPAIPPRAEGARTGEHPVFAAPVEDRPVAPPPGLGARPPVGGSTSPPPEAGPPEVPPSRPVEPEPADPGRASAPTSGPPASPPPGVPAHPGPPLAGVPAAGPPPAGPAAATPPPAPPPATPPPVTPPRAVPPPAQPPRPAEPIAPADPVDRTVVREKPAPRAGWRVEFDNGQSFRVEGLGLVGRRPEPRPGEQVTHLVPLQSQDMSLSKTHAQFHLAPEGVLVVMDRGSTNGSVLIRQGVSRDLAAGRPVTLVEGDRVRFGDREMTVAREG